MDDYFKDETVDTLPIIRLENISSYNLGILGTKYAYLI
ncbi:hypothetical protein RINTHH_16740 [Richelia intracellularis HH01]|uniref:Uncharacterized protein n=1 Tax=Richelia intracellularis HH01 TaxID=1165094 RepID=M1WT60_9NOST|nr:hypothetical protein RINTHH_16740 [Richelia intracellularis HH01]